MDKAMHSEFEGHTPGAWKTNALYSQVHSEHGQIQICLVSVNENNEEFNYEQWRANARLIAAAPGLLKENQSLRSELQKQKELNAELVNGLELANKAFVDSLNKYIDWIPTQEINEAFTLIESLIKKSKPA